jgi:hypothetical protein
MSQWRLVPITKIDSNRWDACVRAHRRDVFSEFWYWSTVCSSWQAWIKGDYDDVIALPAERKWGIIPFMRTPLYVKWLEGDQVQLQYLIQSFFGFRRIHVRFEMKGAGKRSLQRMKLDAEWNPSRELAKNVRKAESENPEFISSVQWSEFSIFMKHNHPYQWPSVQQHVMQKLFERAVERGVGEIAGVKMHGQWAAMQFYIFDNSRSYLVQNAVSSEWRNREPMPFLLHTLFRQWQEQCALVSVNFMGSNNPGVARFNEKFGAETTHYWEFPRGQG